MADKLLLTVPEAAERLSLGRTKAYELVLSGRIESVKVGTARRVPVDALDRYVESLRHVGDVARA